MAVEKQWQTQIFDEKDIKVISEEVDVSRLIAKILCSVGFNARNYSEINSL